MTYRKAITIFFSELLDQPEAVVARLVDQLDIVYPEKYPLDEELPIHQAQEFFFRMHADKDAVLAWMEKGQQEAKRAISEAASPPDA